MDILFQKHINVDVIETDEDYEGCIFRVTVEIDSLKFQIITVHGPNPENAQDSERFFFHELKDFVETDVPCILLGDFNMVLDLVKDRC